jgi:HAMP domain-containing protein
MVLVAMGCVALAFSFMLVRKSRALGRLSKNLSAGVFSKTFNVFDPSMERRRIISSHTGLVVFIAIYGAWFALTIGVITTFAFGGLLASAIFLVCAGLLMVDETMDLNKNAGIFAKAISGGTGLGKGDLQVLWLMRKMLPRLSRYHLVLAAVFFASAFAVPYLSNVIFLACADVAWVFFALSSLLMGVPLLSAIVVAGLFGVVIVLVMMGADEAKKVLFGFPRSVRLDVLDRQFERMHLYTSFQHHHPALHEPLPEDTENINRKDLEEHGGS